MNTESIQQRAKEAANEMCQRTLIHPKSVAGEAMLDVLTKTLTAQQAESKQAHGAEVDRLTKERDEAKHLLSMEQAAYGSMSKLHYTLQDQHKELRAERDVLTRQVEELTNDKEMLDWLSTRSWNVFWLGTDTWGIAGVTTRGTLREAIDSAMKGKTNE